MSDNKSKMLRRIEGNFLKTSIDMPTRCHSTKLLAAMEVLETTSCIEKSKLGFFLRLLNNDFTKSIIEEEVKYNFPGSYVCEVAKISNVDTAAADIDTLVESAAIRLANIKCEQRMLKKPATGEIVEIRSLFENYDDNDKIKLFNLIKF